MPTSKIIANWKNKVFDAVYWLEGEEPYYIDQVVNYAEHHLLSEADQSFNLTVFYGKDADWAQIINACKRYPVNAEKQVVICATSDTANRLKVLSQKFIKIWAELMGSSTMLESVTLLLFLK